MRTQAILGLVATLTVIGCSQPRVATYTRPTPKPILIDEYSVLDDRSSAPSLADAQLQKQLELARAHYLKALKLVESNDQKDAAKHFEASVALLNDLVTHPDIDALPEYTRLSQSVIRDYEDKITSIESLDSNSSFFVLRDKMFQEIELLPVSWRKPAASEAMTGEEIADTLQVILSDNDAVDQTIAFFTSEKGRKFFSKWLSRSGRYFPMYERILAEEGAPDEIKYLSMIESGLNTRVTSKAQAVGLWQFIAPTGKEYGMRIDWYRDERRDPEKATRAAARYLLDLYEDMGDWHLALASYNCGPGRMRRALRRADTVDYWIARNFLPRETQRYVPLYIAAAKIARDPEAYGFTDIDLQQPDIYEVVPVNGAYSFETLANAVNLTVGDLRELNPELLRDQIPPGERDYLLKVPAGYSTLLASALDTIPAPEEAAVSWIRHKVRRGETVSRIAARYGVGVSEVLEANGMNRRSTLLRGKVLRIPVRAESSSSDDADAIADNDEQTDDDQNEETESKAVASNNAAPTTNVTAGERAPSSPAKAAAKSDALAADNEGLAMELAAPTAERKANQPPLPEVVTEQPVAGAASSIPETRQVLDHVNEAKAAAAAKNATPKHEVVLHKVSRGETLSAIAAKYGVSMDDVRDWNPKGVTRNNDVLLGATLRIHGVAAPAAGEPITTGSASEPIAVVEKKAEKPSRTVAKRSTTTSTSRRPKRYKVRRGETLTSIADKFGVSVRDLRNNNPRMNPNRLQAGQVIRLR